MSDIKCTLGNLIEVDSLIRTNDIKMIESALKTGYNVNKRGRNGQTLLHWAAEKGHIDVARLLIEANADVTARDGLQRTSLHLATYYGRIDVAKLLIEAKADVNACDYEQRTPCIWHMKVFALRALSSYSSKQMRV